MLYTEQIKKLIVRAVVHCFQWLHLYKFIWECVMSSCCQLFLTQWPLVMIGQSWGICVAALAHLGEKYSLEQVDLNGINCWIAIHVAALGQPTKIYESFDEKNHGEFWRTFCSICVFYNFTFYIWILKFVCCKQWNFCAICMLHIAFIGRQYEGPV